MENQTSESGCATLSYRADRSSDSAKSIVKTQTLQRNIMCACISTRDSWQILYRHDLLVCSFPDSSEFVVGRPKLPEITLQETQGVAGTTMRISILPYKPIEKQLPGLHLC